MPTELRDAPRLDARPEAAPVPPPVGPNRSRVRAAGVVLGLGLGGFVDGIVFHMLLQWHHVLCVNCQSPAQTTDDLRRETFSDGVFHLATLGLVVAGLFLLWRAVTHSPTRLPARYLTATLALGWGIFNVVEGLVDHHILGLHHVKPGPGQLAWDLAFLASGAALALGGWAWMRAIERRPEPQLR